MILLEYIIAQHQDGNLSVAINSRKVKKQNPAIMITRNHGIVIWELRGLFLGENQSIPGDPRVTRIDFYIGMEDLIEQRGSFLNSIGVSLGLPLGLRNPVGSERTGGTKIRWRGAIGRINIENVETTMPPFKLTYNVNSALILNIDTESSPYPIVSEGGHRTMKELHFGIEHDYTIRQRRNLAIPRLKIEMTENQYTTILEYIDRAITFYGQI